MQIIMSVSVISKSVKFELKYASEKLPLHVNHLYLSKILQILRCSIIDFFSGPEYNLHAPDITFIRQI